jgi:hypothetical protein
MECTVSVDARGLDCVVQIGLNVHGVCSYGSGSPTLVRDGVYCQCGCARTRLCGSDWAECTWGSGSPSLAHLA